MFVAIAYSQGTKTNLSRGAQNIANCFLAVRDRHQHLPDAAPATPEAHPARRLRPGDRPRRRRRHTARGVAVGRALPRRRARLRAARERRARVHRRAPAPAGHPARGPDPAPGARLLRRRTRKALDTTVPSVNSALQRARKAVEERAPGAQPAGDAARARRRQGARGGRALHGRDGARRRRRDGGDARGRTPTWSMPPLTSWFGGLAQVRGFPRARPAVGRVALAPSAGLGQRAGGGRRLRLGRGELVAPAVRARRP